MKIWQKRHSIIIALIIIILVLILLPDNIKAAFVSPFLFVAVPLLILFHLLKPINNHARNLILTIYLVKILFILLFFNSAFFNDVIVNTNVDHFSYAEIGRENALKIRQGDTDIYPPIKLDNHSLWWHLNTLIYLVFGFNPILLSLLNVFISSIMQYILFKAVFKISGFRPAFISLIVIAAFPSFVLFSLTNHKDILISTLLLAFTVNLIEDKSKYHNIITVIALFFLRIYIGIFAIIAMFSYPMFKTVKNKYFWLGLLISLILVLSPMAQPIFNKINKVRDQTHEGDSAVPYTYEVDSGLSALIALPQLASSYIAGPNPLYIFDSKNSKYILALPDLIIWYCVLLLSIRGIYIAHARKILKQRQIVIMLFLAGMIVVFSSLIEANYGTIMRKRMALEILMMLFFGVGIKK